MFFFYILVTIPYFLKFLMQFSTTFYILLPFKKYSGTLFENNYNSNMSETLHNFVSCAREDISDICKKNLELIKITSFKNIYEQHITNMKENIEKQIS